MKTGIKPIFALLLCVLILLLPMIALAVGEDPEVAQGVLEAIEAMLTPGTGIWWSLLIVAGIIAADTAFGIILGIREKELDVRLLPQFLLTGVAPYLGALIILALLGYFIDPVEGMFYAAAITVVGKYFWDLVGKFKSLLFGPEAIPRE